MPLNTNSFNMPNSIDGKNAESRTFLYEEFPTWHNFDQETPAFTQKEVDSRNHQP